MNKTGKAAVMTADLFWCNYYIPSQQAENNE